MSTARCRLIDEQGAAYAFGALSADEREAVEAHAPGCPDCARELAELRDVAANLALSLQQHEPSPELGSRILSEARRDSLQPLPSTPVGPAPEPRPAAPIKTGAGRRIPWLSLGTLAAALAALIWGAALQAQLGATQRQLDDTSGQLERLRGAYATVVEVLASPDGRERELAAREGAPESKGKVWIDQATGRGMMMARDLPALPADQTYQVWLVNDQGRVSGGFLRPYDNGVYYVVLQAPAPLTSYRSLGVTREPLGGSPVPTGPRIIGGEI